MTVSALTVADQAAAAAAGDSDAFSALFERYHDPLLRYIALRTAHNVAVAEDIAGATWEQVARTISGFEERGDGFPAWLFTIARRAVQQHYRALTRRPERLDGDMLAWDLLPDGGDDVDATVARREMSAQLAAAVRCLKPSQRRCVTLRFFVGLSVAETADVMGKTPNAVKQLQHRSLNVLRKRVPDFTLGDYHADTHVREAEYEATKRTPIAQEEGAR